MGFDWRTEDEQAWEQDLTGDPAGETRAPRRVPRWLVVVLSVVVVGGLAAWWLNRQTEEAVSGVRDEVLSSHALVLSTVARDDRELFEGQLDWQETTGWLAMQKELFDQAQLFNRRFLGLNMLAGAVAPTATEPAVDLAPDLEAATVTFARAYSVTVPSRNPAGVEETVRLQQTFRYRLQAEDRRWLLTGPPDGFWGEQRTLATDWLTLTYPERDEALVQRLGEAIDAVLDVLCAQVVEVACAEVLDVTVHLETDTRAWDGLLELSRPGLRGSDLVLPAPTLVGLPVDESGYQALYRGYAAHVVLAAVDQLRIAGASMSAHDFLIQVRLRPWPLLPSRGRRITDAPVPLPQSVQMLCKGASPAGTLQRFDPATANQTIQLPGRTFLAARTTADDAGLFLLEQRMVDGESQVHLIRWQDGEEQLLFAESWSPEDGEWRLGRSSPSERFLILIFYRADSSSRFVNPAFTLVDLAACGDGGCESRQLTGYPTWSPDERYVLVQEFRPNDANLVLRGDGELQTKVQVGQGWNPVWLDEDTYSYWSIRGNVIIADVESLQAATMIEAADVRAAFPEEGNLMVSLVANPAGPDYLYAYQLIETMIDSRGRPVLGGADSLLFPLNESDNVSVSGSIDIPGEHTFQPRLSPDGRWLYFLEQVRARNGWRLQLYALPPDGVGPLALRYERFYPDAAPYLSPITPEVAWSAGGDWLLVGYDGVADLIAPAEAYHRVVVPETPGCVFDWIE